MDIGLVKKIGLQIELLARPFRASALDGKELFTITHRTETLELIIQGHRELMTFYVFKSPSQALVLGYLWLKKHNPHVDWRSGQILSWGKDCEGLCFGPQAPKITETMINVVSSDSATDPEYPDLRTVPTCYHHLKEVFSLVEVTGLTEKFTFNPKEGIDNPVMVITEDSESVSTPSPRFCVLKREEGESYGFHLRVEKGRQGHVIRNVVTGGVAGRVGLRDGDRLLEVNNYYVDDVPHSEVARKIKLSGHQLCLLVLDGVEYEQAVSRGQDLQSLVRVHKGFKPPRLCHITRDPVSGLGISFTPVEGEKGRFTVNLVTGGAAEKAGVCKGDHLVWMDGAIVSDLTHSALSRMKKKCGDHITVLVIDNESEKNYKRQRIPILPTMAVSHNLPHRARKLHLVSGCEGYGFLLRLEKTSSGRTFHVLRGVDSGGPAEKAGMKDGELLLEVNGESVESLSHGDIVDRVRLSGQQVSITTITPRGLEFYTRLGLSPLLFSEDDAAEKETESSTPASAAEQSPQKEMDVSCKPRHCSLQRGPLGFGFNLGCVPQRPGTFISQVASGGSGQSAGLLVGDVVLEVNGQNVEEQYLEDVILLVKEGGHFLSLLVIDETGYNKLKSADTLTRDITDNEEEDNYEISSL
uniref:PDZ domain containing 3b isoform X2 n=1 Tax=Scatophagus argus TaxID=75038 RepID=UPI001ED82F55|nr:PDZ domain containing 3b isoform X2 [Scatophagus argus]